MYGQFPMVSIGRPHLVSSPRRSSQPGAGGARLSQRGRWPPPPVSGLSGEQEPPWLAGPFPQLPWEPVVPKA